MAAAAPRVRRPRVPNESNQARQEAMNAPDSCELAYLDRTESPSIPLRIDFARKLEVEVRGQAVSVDGTLDPVSVRALTTWQVRHHLPATGEVDLMTRLALEERFDETLLGPHLEPRVLLEADADEAARYAFYKSVIEDSGDGAFVPSQRQLLTIRGVQKDDEGAIVQSDSAQREADGDEDHRHFSSAENGFDDLFVTVWTDADGPRVSERHGTVDPNLVWSEDGHNHDASEGSAHIRDGQYLYELGKHGTSHHGKDVKDWSREHPDERASLAARGGSRVNYTGFNPLNLEIWRDDGAKDDHRLDAEEVRASRLAVAAGDPRYSDPDAIRANLHTAGDEPSSLGCMNVPLDGGYVQMLEELTGGCDTQIRVTVIDGSKIDL